jgi:hypothetical protein
MPVPVAVGGGLLSLKTRQDHMANPHGEHSRFAFLTGVPKLGKETGTVVGCEVESP